MPLLEMYQLKTSNIVNNNWIQSKLSCFIAGIDLLPFQEVASLTKLDQDNQVGQDGREDARQGRQLDPEETLPIFTNLF